MKFVVVAVALFCSSYALALDARLESLKDQTETPGAILRILARDYLKRVSTEDAEKKWDQKFTQRVRERAEASGLTEEQVVHAIFQDWAIGQRKFLEDPASAPESTLIEACRFVNWSTNHGVPLPQRLYKQLTHEHVNVIRGALSSL